MGYYIVVTAINSEGNIIAKVDLNVQYYSVIEEDYSILNKRIDINK